MPEIRIGSTISRLNVLMIDTGVSKDIRIPEIKERENTEMLSNVICSQLLSVLKVRA